jgi:hypothetical protein
VGSPFLPSKDEARFRKAKSQGEGQVNPWAASHSYKSPYLEGCLAVVISDIFIGSTEKQDTSTALLLGDRDSHIGKLERCNWEAMAGVHKEVHTDVQDTGITHRHIDSHLHIHCTLGPD